MHLKLSITRYLVLIGNDIKVYMCVYVAHSKLFRLDRPSCDHTYTMNSRENDRRAPSSPWIMSPRKRNTSSRIQAASSPDCRPLKGILKKPYKVRRSHADLSRNASDSERSSASSSESRRVQFQSEAHIHSSNDSVSTVSANNASALPTSTALRPNATTPDRIGYRASPTEQQQQQFFSRPVARLRDVRQRTRPEQGVNGRICQVGDSVVNTTTTTTTSRLSGISSPLPGSPRSAQFSYATLVSRTPPQLDIRAITKRYEGLLCALKRPRICARCSLQYTPSVNFTGWWCKTHVGTVDRQLGRWSCCQQSTENSHLGCRPCMHASTRTYVEQMRREPFDATLVVPRILVLCDLVNISRAMYRPDICPIPPIPKTPEEILAVIQAVDVEPIRIPMVDMESLILWSVS